MNKIIGGTTTTPLVPTDEEALLNQMKAYVDSVALTETYTPDTPSRSVYLPENLGVKSVTFEHRSGISSITFETKTSTMRCGNYSKVDSKSTESTILCDSSGVMYGNVRQILISDGEDSSVNIVSVELYAVKQLTDDVVNALLKLTARLDELISIGEDNAIRKSKAYTDEKLANIDVSSAVVEAKTYTDERIGDCMVMHPITVNSSSEWIETELTGLEADKLKFVKISCDDAHFNTLNQYITFAPVDGDGNATLCDFSATCLVESSVIVDLSSKTLYRLFADGHTEEVEVIYDYDDKDAFFSAFQHIKACVLSCISELNCKAEFYTDESVSGYIDSKLESAKEEIKAYADEKTKCLSKASINNRESLYLGENNGIKSIKITLREDATDGGYVVLYLYKKDGSTVHIDTPVDEVGKSFVVSEDSKNIDTEFLEAMRSCEVAYITTHGSTQEFFNCDIEAEYYVSPSVAIGNVDSKIGDIDATLDGIIAIQNGLLGVSE